MDQNHALVLIYPMLFALIIIIYHSCLCVFVYVVLKAVERINAGIRAGVAEDTVEELMNPDAQLPEVYPSAADLYQRELFSLQQQSAEVNMTTDTGEMG